MNKYFSLLLMCIGLTWSVQSVAQLSNDECANALTVNASAGDSCELYNGSFLGANQETPPNLCDSLESTTAFDQWFSFTASVENHLIDVETPDNGGFQGTGAIIELYDACGGNLLQCANPDYFEAFGFIIVQSGLTRIRANSLTVGNDYLLRVYPYGEALPEPGNDLFTLCIKAAPNVPLNDTCANAVSLMANDSCVSIIGTVDGATEGADTALCAPDASPTAYDVWYTFSPNDATQIIEVKPTAEEADLAPVIELWDSCGGNVINCANPDVFPFIGVIPGDNVLRSENLDTNANYWVRVYHYGEEPPVDGEFEICVRKAPPAPENDSCSNAIALMVNDTCNPTQGTLVSANQEVDPNTCDTTSATAFDVWYSFEANERGQIIEVNSGEVAAVIELWESCGGNMIDCAEPQIFGGFVVPGNTTLQNSVLDSGVNYIIRVYNFGEEVPENADFDICVYNVPLPPENDDCDNAMTITMADNRANCNAVSVTTIGATQSNVATSCDDFPLDDDIWFKFEAISERAVAVASNKSGDIFFTNIGFALYETDCATEISCVDFTEVDTMLFTGLEVGKEYILRAYTDDIDVSGDFDLCVYATLPGIENDECSGAIVITATSDDNCVPTQGSFADATQEMDPEICDDLESDNAYDQWFAFEALGEEHIVEVTTQETGGFEGVGAVVNVYDSCDGNFIACGNPNVFQQGGFTIVQSGTTSVPLSDLTPGNMYYVRVYNYGDSLPQADVDDFTICVRGPNAPIENDTCVVATDLQVNDSCVPTTATLEGANEEREALDCNGEAASESANDIWFRFEAKNALQIVEVNPVGGFNGAPTVVELYDNCDDEEPLYCAFPQIVGGGFAFPGTVTINTNDLDSGSFYYVRVYEYGDQGADKGIEICVYNDPSIGVSERESFLSKVYPNPVSDILNIDLKSKTSQMLVSLIDASGRVVLQEKVKNIQSLKVDVSKVSSGIYQLSLSDGTSTEVTRVTIK